MRPMDGQDRFLEQKINQPLGRAVASAQPGYLDLDPVARRRGANQTSPSRKWRQDRYGNRNTLDTGNLHG